MSSFTGWHFWAIITKDDGEKLQACFSSRLKCVEWLKLQKEECFFETGSMDAAEEKWGADNFKFEEVFVLSRDCYIDRFGPIKSKKWCYDI